MRSRLASLEETHERRELISMSHVIKIAFLGAECTGKTTLAQKLTEVYKKQYPSAFVPEVVRLFVEENNRTPKEEEQVAIAQRQKQLESELAAQLIQDHQDAEFVFLFCDTTPLLTGIYSEVVFGSPDAAVNKFAQDHDYDLTLFTQIDFPWKSDGIMRDSPLAQAKVHYRIQARLDKLQIPYEIISGDLNKRVKTTEKHIQELLNSLIQ